MQQKVFRRQNHWGSVFNLNFDLNFLRWCPLFVVVCLGMVSDTRGQETVGITEFLAGNNGGLVDEDGDSSDWIEIYNSGSASVDLAGWFLTDVKSDLRRWTFPAVSLAPKSFLIVFASGKDRTAPAAPLHTNFKLSQSGGYLALVHGDTVVTELSYPEQRPNFSYGFAQTVSSRSLLTPKALARILVPTDGTLGTSWSTNGFNDSGWIHGTNGVGYETTIPGFAVRNFKANIAVDSLAKADDVITNSARQSAIYSENNATVNYLNTGSGAHFPGDNTFPGMTINQDQDDFVLETVATLTIPSAGDWTFGVNSDDGFRLVIDGFAPLLSDPPRGPTDTFGTITFLAPGDYPLRLVYYEQGGGAEVELFAAPGNQPGFGPAFHLVGDVANGGLAIRSNPIQGGSGVGYGSLITTSVKSQMLSHNSSAYVRLPFSLTNAAGVESLTLRLNYDDGVIAYLNGIEVARRNAPASADWNATATAEHPGSPAASINISDRIGLLREGDNVLALQGLNRSAQDADFLLAAELIELKTINAGSTNYFSVATPGAFNTSPTFGGFVGQVSFSADHGFYETNISCVLTTATAGATIRYTLNGTVPSAVNGQTYSGPIRITNTTTLRAMALRTGLVASSVEAATYIFVNDVIRQSANGVAPPGWPANWGANSTDYGMDPDIVNSPIWGPSLKDDLKAIPSFSIVMNLDDLFAPGTGIYANPGGDELTWERPCSLELIQPDGTKGFQINCGIRIRGGFSRSTTNPKHAFRFFFRGDYGESKLHYKLFGDAGADTYDKIDLRTFQNYSWAFQGDARMICLRDQMSRDLEGAMGKPTERGEFYHLYVNGQYWGLYNTDERAEAGYGETYFGGHAEDYDTVKVDPDLGYNIEPTDGTLDAYFRLWSSLTNNVIDDETFYRLQGLNLDGTPNPAYENLLDTDDLIDYMLIIYYGGNLDAPISNFLSNQSPNNYFAIRNRLGLSGGFKYFVHDAEHTLLDVNENRLGPWPAGSPANPGGFLKASPQYFFQQLWSNLEFRTQVGDHIQKNFFNGGVLTPPALRSHFLVRSNEIYRAINCESARWGDAQHNPPFNRNDWVAAMNTAYGYMGSRTAVVLAQLKSKNLYPAFAAPLLNTTSGLVLPGFLLSLTNTVVGATLYYTLDGSDPRLRGGAVSPDALAYSPGTTIPVNSQMTIQARVKGGDIWSALVVVTLYPAQDFGKLLISEIMYNPRPSPAYAGDEFEFLELKNAGTNILDLSGIRFTTGIDFVFTNGTRLAPGQFLVIGRNPTALLTRYPNLVLNGVYSGKLDNGGETLTLSHALGTRILSVSYGDSGRWPVTPDGFGFSLVSRNPNANPDADLASNWRASAFENGSPGADDPASTIPPVLINELLANSVLPRVDTLELYNPTDQPVNLGGWWLSDSAAQPFKFRIPNNTTIAARAFRTFDESDFNPTPGTNGSFALSSGGESVYLFSGDGTTNLTGYSYGFSFDASPTNTTLGRYVTSTGEEKFELEIADTLGQTNAGPRVGPVVIKQILYHPPDLAGGVDNASDEFVEIVNITSDPVPLFDPLAPMNTWHIRGGIGFDFPTNVTLPGAASLVLVHFDPHDPTALAAFRSKYGLLSSLPAYGPYTGKLNNDQDTVEIKRPDAPSTNGVNFIRVDRVIYSDHAPWPPAADGGGASLQRLRLTEYGDDPINWASFVPLTIGQQPTNLTVRAGSNTVLSVVAAGNGPLTYRWRLDETNLIDSPGFSGSTTPTLTITNAYAQHRGDYSVVVSDSNGSATSLPAKLTVLIPPAIEVQPQNVTAVAGDKVTLSITISNTASLPLGFRWRRAGATVSSFATNQYISTLVLANVQASATYSVVITNAASSVGILSAPAQLTVLADSDGDHIPDVWEDQYGLNRNDPADAALDSDGDGLSNYQEYLAGTNPTNAASYLRLEAARPDAPGGVILQFNAVSNKTYSIFSRGEVAGGNWQRWIDIVGAPTNRSVTVTNVHPEATRQFYRLVTPQAP